MSDNHELYSPYIQSGIISETDYPVFRSLTGLFFRKMSIDQESMLILNEYKDKGKIVYASMQTTYTSFFILLNKLKKNGLPVPSLALGFVPYSYQKISVLFREAINYLKKLLKIGDSNFVTNSVYIGRALNKDRAIAFSMLSRKLFFRSYVQIKTDSIDYLLELQKKTEDPIYVFPQVIFWNRNPEKSRSVFISEATGDRGLLSGMFTIWKSATPAFLRVGKPVNLKEELENDPDVDIPHLSRKVRNRLLEIYNYEKRSILGPQIKTQQEMMEKVLYHKNVMDAIQQEMTSKGASEKSFRKKAFSYFREIAADFSIVYIKFFEATNNYLFSKIFDGMHYDLESFKKVREASSRGPLILVPSHKSHMDYLIISSLFYANKIIPPHILAGSNLTFFPMGKIFRRSGAFFMRRTFKGLNLYAAVFKQYVKTLINEGYTIEFFIEGTRSRTGKIVSPKMGMLKYLIEAVDEGYNKDLVFVPITVNYDRVLEENSYLKEIKGREKKTESTSGFFKSRKLIQKKYGNVYMEFNEPFTLKEVREKFRKEKNVTDIDELVIELGNYIISTINDIVVVTPFAVTTAALLNTTARGFSRDLIRERIMLLLSFLKNAHYPLAKHIQTDENIDAVIDTVLASYMKDGIISSVDSSQTAAEVEGLYLIDHDQRGRISMYKNSIMHMMLPINLVSLALLATAGTGKTTRQKVSEEFEKLRDLLSREFVYPESIYKTDAVIESTTQYLESRNIINIRGKDITIEENGAMPLKFYSGMIQDYLESLLIVINGVAEIQTATIPRKELVSDIRKTGVRMYNLGEIQCSESLSVINYNNAVDMMCDAGILKIQGDGKSSVVNVRDKTRLDALLASLNNYLDRVRG